MVDFIQSVVTGFAISLGSFVGTWFGQRHIEGRLNKIEAKLLGKKEDVIKDGTK